MISRFIPWTWYPEYKGRGWSTLMCPCSAHRYELQRRQLEAHVQARFLAGV